MRPIDDCTAALINAATSKREKMRPDTVDSLYELTRLLFREARFAMRRARAGGPFSRSVASCRAFTSSILTRHFAECH